ncbi:MAG: 3D domain-containing protein [Defluviitaleaceae bacterium]|nr:3D domain-containing protein [Defluviitaleaceae bacterium]
MKSIRAIFVVLLAVVAVTVFPLGLMSFIAAESELTKVTLVDNGEAREFLVGAKSVADFFHEMGVSYNTLDRISHPTESFLWDGITVSIEREITYYVQTDGGEFIPQVARPGTTVADILRQMQQVSRIALVYNGDEDVPIKNGDVLSVDTWVTQTEVELISLPYETIENHTSSVPRGQQHLRIEGEQGEKAVTTSVVYIAGKQEQRNYVGTEVLREPTDAILDIGTGWLGSLANVNAPDFHYSRHLRMEASAYTKYYGCTGKNPGDPGFGITASGRPVQHGIVAVDRSVIPLGTRLYVDGYGFAIAADVGGAIRGDKIDLYMETIEEALRFGRRNIDVWVLD